MGLFDLWNRVGLCPICRSRGALIGLFKVRCPNPACAKYDALRTSEVMLQTSPAPSPLPVPVGTFETSANSLEIRYRNFQGLDRRYTGDRRTLRLTGRHYSLRLVPTGERVNFDKRYIQNLEDVEKALPEKGPKPSLVERQILGYHLKNHSTSPRFEEVRRKFPDWEPR